MARSKKRLRGRVTTVGEVNSYYPKFVVTNEDPYTQRNIYDSSELSIFDNSQRIFEPIEPGLGVEHEILFIRQGRKTYVFAVDIPDAITWGNKIITFGDDYNFASEEM